MRLAISIILLLAALSLLFFWGRTLWNDIQVLRVEKSSYESVIARLNTLRKTRDNLLASYNAISAQELKKIKNFLPENANHGLFVVQMSNMANESGLLLKNINIAAREERSSEVPVSISVSGSYQNFIGFLNRLERSLRLIDVAKLSFTAGRDGFYDFNLEAKTYTQK
ncbi:MAG: type 4a pilus biogenesis protein PilO [Candidatus Niyogibacteria bacterium]|nr:MAG: type 4a pilus biogenesis protein PilO [Candidatus Niyogibacteria bacterium]